MLTEPLYQSLQTLGLRGMARQFASQQKLPNNDLSFEDRFSLLIDAEQSERMNYRYAQRVRWAKLGQSASMEDIDQRTPRGIDKGLLSKLNDLSFIRDKLNVLITGLTGVGVWRCFSTMDYCQQRRIYAARCKRQLHFN